ncbi:Ion-translocating oxidoreductase complex subunit D [Buchnera aphidicola (Eriosoma grossulariae)]|uniref:RnfABCDGE type electron transport complex subunit D n=1 Tax=Buchnera aphidicola TaxID=9 RepID=UPI0034644A4B
MNDHNYTINKIMFLTIISLIPGIIIQSIFFGYGVLIQIFIAIIVSVCTEFICLYLRGVDYWYHISDNSVLVSAILFGLCLPILIPWWVIVIGSIFMIVLGKQLYGGIGQNIFNPAMVGYVIILISFPVIMTNFNFFGVSIAHLFNFIDSLNLIFFCDNNFHDSNNIFITQATPLNNIKLNQHILIDSIINVSKNNIQNLSFYSNFFWINFCFLLGGIYLLFKKIICWRIPMSFLLSLFTLSFFSSVYLPNVFLSPKINLFSGSTMLGAFFVLTDPVTSSTTNLGKIIFGVLIGFFVWIIRSFGNYPDAIAFSVLLGNSLVPLIDIFTKPKVYGDRKNI